MNITVKRVFRLESSNNLRAFVDIEIDEALLIKGLKVIKGKNGHFVSMPQEQAKDGKWYDSIRPLNESVKKQIENTILDSYNQE